MEVRGGAIICQRLVFFRLSKRDVHTRWEGDGGAEPGSNGDRKSVGGRRRKGRRRDT